MQIEQIELCTPSLAAVEAFYSHTLGLPVLSRKEHRISFRIGYSTLTFVQTTGAVGVYHFALLIPKNKVKEAYDWLSSKTPVLPFSAQTDIADFTNWNAQAFYFHDHHQNILELISHQDLPYTAATDFSANAIVGICELGVVVDNVTAACTRLHNNFGIPYFAKGPYLADFAVMGEEDGLLIISAKGRGWLPTGQAAIPKPFNISLKVNGQTKTIFDSDVEGA